MSDLETYNLRDLIAIDPSRKWAGRSDDPRCIIPGEAVRHKHDLHSYGMCISRRQEEDLGKVLCEVIWSKSPRQFKTPTLPPQTLRAQWSSESDPDYLTFPEFMTRYGSLENLMNEQSDVTDVIMHQNPDPKGDPWIEIKRRRPEPQFDIVYGIEGRAYGKTPGRY